MGRACVGVLRAMNRVRPPAARHVTKLLLFIVQKSRFSAGEISHLLEHVSMIRGAPVCTSEGTRRAS